MDPKRVQDLSNISLFNRFERAVSPSSAPATETPPVDVNAIIAEQRAQLQRKYNVTPRLTGSLATKLNLPNDADVDFFIPVHSRQKFQNLVNRIKSNREFAPSAYNVDNAAYHVFTRSPNEQTPIPIDMAIAYGQPAKDYTQALNTRIKNTAQLTPELREAILAKKQLLKHTPFDIGNRRYKDWKRELDSALGPDMRLRRQSLDKVAAIVDINDPQEQAKLQKYLAQDNVYGHRTRNIESVLQQKRIMSALEALKRKLLTSYERGSSVGTHQTISPLALPKEDLGLLESKLLTDTPDESIYNSMAEKHQTDAESIKREFLGNRFSKIRKWVSGQKDPEQVRLDRFAIPKLSPTIFATRGGVLDEPAYGDYSVLFRSNTAKRSPYMNLLTNEHIIPQRSALTPRSIRLKNNYVMAPKAELERLHGLNPDMNYMASEDLSPELKEKLLLPTRSLSEVTNRIIPNMLSGDFRVQQTR